MSTTPTTSSTSTSKTPTTSSTSTSTTPTTSSTSSSTTPSTSSTSTSTTPTTSSTSTSATPTTSSISTSTTPTTSSTSSSTTPTTSSTSTSTTPTTSSTSTSTTPSTSSTSTSTTPTTSSTSSLTTPTTSSISTSTTPTTSSTSSSTTPSTSSTSTSTTPTTSSTSTSATPTTSSTSLSTTPTTSSTSTSTTPTTSSTSTSTTPTTSSTSSSTTPSTSSTSTSTTPTTSSTSTSTTPTTSSTSSSTTPTTSSTSTSTTPSTSSTSMSTTPTTSSTSTSTTPMTSSTSTSTTPMTSSTSTSTTPTTSSTSTSTTPSTSSTSTSTTPTTSSTSTSTTPSTSSTSTSTTPTTSSTSSSTTPTTSSTSTSTTPTTSSTSTSTTPTTSSTSSTTTPTTSSTSTSTTPTTSSTSSSTTPTTSSTSSSTTPTTSSTSTSTTPTTSSTTSSTTPTTSSTSSSTTPSTSSTSTSTTPTTSSTSTSTTPTTSSTSTSTTPTTSSTSTTPSTSSTSSSTTPTTSSTSTSTTPSTSSTSSSTTPSTSSTSTSTTPTTSSTSTSTTPTTSSTSTSTTPTTSSTSTSTTPTTSSTSSSTTPTTSSTSTTPSTSSTTSSTTPTTSSTSSSTTPSTSSTSSSTTPTTSSTSSSTTPTTSSTTSSTTPTTSSTSTSTTPTTSSTSTSTTPTTSSTSSSTTPTTSPTTSTFSTSTTPSLTSSTTTVTLSTTTGSSFTTTSVSSSTTSSRSSSTTSVTYTPSTSYTTTPSVCIVSILLVNGTVSPSGVIGHVETDNINGQTNPDEHPVYVGDTVEAGVEIYVTDCKDCYCLSDGTFMCNTTQCECTYTMWTTWSDCSADCGSGWEYRHREKMAGNEACDDNEESKPCYNDRSCTSTTPCGTWSTWSDCNCTASNKLRQRTRDGCEEGTEEESCADMCPSTTTPVCTDDKVPSCFFPCEDSCLGYRKPESCIEEEECVMGCKCPEGMRDLDGVCVNQTDCPCYDNKGNAVMPNHPVNTTVPCQTCICNEDNQIECENIPECCDYHEWQTWSSCSADCGNGTRYRIRQGYGSGCDDNDMREEEPCKVEDCKCIIDGKEYVENEVIRDCMCEVCICGHTGVEICHVKPDGTADGGFSAWSEWTNCTKSCEGGVRSRSRLCDSPVPRCGGNTCEGPTYENEQCNVDVPCCDVSDWSPWNACSATCGAASKSRSRALTNKNVNQAACGKALEETIDCPENLPCSTTCKVSEWSDWSACDEPCGTGIQKRERTLTSGSNCEHIVLADMQVCKEKDCTCQPPFVWSNHSLCNAQTCENQMVPDDCMDTWSPECVCPPGTYLRGVRECVDITECFQCLVDGEYKQPGETWESAESCEMCQCDNGIVKCQPIMEPPQCEENEEVTYEDGPCCGKCTPKKDQCSLKSVSKQILTVGDCVSTELVSYDYCSGYCNRSISHPVMTGLPGYNSIQADSCECCRGVPSGEDDVKVLMQCPHEEVYVYIQKLKSCTCTQCAEQGTTTR